MLIKAGDHCNEVDFTIVLINLIMLLLIVHKMYFHAHYSSKSIPNTRRHVIR